MSNGVPSLKTNIHNDLLNLLKAEVSPAVGCTEPAAVALACARGKSHLPGKLSRLHVSVGRNIFKNGLKVGIPGTQQKGLVVAAALGYVCGDPETGLEVLGSVDPDGAKVAEQMVAEKIVTLGLDETFQGIYVKSTLTDNEGNIVEIVLEGTHTNIVLIKLNGEELYSNSPIDNDSLHSSAHSKLSIENIFTFARDCDVEKLRFIIESAKMNMKVAEEGLSTDYGMAIGRMMHRTAPETTSSEQLEMEAINKAASLAASASDARMAGCSMSVMTNSGSGNQGITATIPLYSIARDMDTDPDTLARALCLSHLLSIYFKYRSERLSAFCGTVTAAIGAACGVGFLYGAGRQEIENIINLSFSGISGMVCDGAKSSCALKIFLAVENALLAAKLALEKHHLPNGEGIVGQSAEETISNVQTLTTDGMKATDIVILSMMKP